jgi:SAM-dependent methyltransferase
MSGPPAHWARWRGEPMYNKLTPQGREPGARSSPADTPSSQEPEHVPVNQPRPADREGHWNHVYESSTPDSRSWYQAEPAVSLSLLAGAGVDPDARLLDVGGGTSLLVDRLLDRAFSNVGVLDVSGVAIEQARSRLGERAGRVEWYHSDIAHFRSPHPWDVWHDRAVFHFLTDEADREGYTRALASALRPGGHLIIAAFSPTGPERCSGLPTVRYSAQSLGETLGPDFEWIESVPESHETPAGRIQDFLYSQFVYRAARN